MNVLITEVLKGSISNGKKMDRILKKEEKECNLKQFDPSFAHQINELDQLNDFNEKLTNDSALFKSYVSQH